MSSPPKRAWYRLVIDMHPEKPGCVEYNGFEASLFWPHPHDMTLQRAWVLLRYKNLLPPDVCILLRPFLVGIRRQYLYVESNSSLTPHSHIGLICRPGDRLAEQKYKDGIT